MSPCAHCPQHPAQGQGVARWRPPPGTREWRPSLLQQPLLGDPRRAIWQETGEDPTLPQKLRRGGSHHTSWVDAACRPRLETSLNSLLVLGACPCRGLPSWARVRMEQQGGGGTHSQALSQPVCGPEDRRTDMTILLSSGPHTGFL